MACILTLTPTRWYRDVRGDVGYTDGLGLTLFHGHRKHRQYSARYDVLKQMRFDPAADVALQNQSGVWMWASDKPELHEAVRIYVGYISVYPCPVRTKGAVRSCATACCIPQGLFTYDAARQCSPRCTPSHTNSAVCSLA